MILLLDRASRVRASAVLVAIGAVVVLLAAILFVLAANDYPLPLIDSSVFLPTAINLAADAGMVNEIRYVYPAPLFPIVLSWLMPSATPTGAFVGLALLGALNLALIGWMLVRVVRATGQRLDEVAGAMIVLSLLAVAIRFADGSGRPEMLATAWVTLGVLLVLATWRVGNEWLTVGLGVLLGLTGATHPNGAVLLGLAIGGVLAARHPWRRALVHIAGSYVLSLLVFALAVGLSPVGIVESVATTLRIGGDLVATGSGLTSERYSLTYFYLLKPTVFLQGLVLLVALAGAVHVGRHNRASVRTPWLLGLFALMFAAFAYDTAIRTPNRSYNLFLFVPVYYAMGLYYVCWLRARRLRWSAPAYAVLLALVSVGFVRQVALFPVYLDEGLSLDEARADFAAMGLTGRPEPVAVTPAMWTLTESYADLEYCLNVRGCDGEPGFFVRQQQEFGTEALHSRMGPFALVYDNFVQHEPKVLGLRLANSMRGYSFAVYERQPDDGTAPDASGTGADVQERAEEAEQQP